MNGEQTDGSTAAPIPDETAVPDAAPWLRSLLFVPASRPELFAKAAASDADAIVLDLEDAVPRDARPEARRHVKQYLRSGAGASHVLVRVNPSWSPDFLADLDACVRPGLLGIVVAKVDSPSNMTTAADALSLLEQRRKVRLGSVRIVPTLETAIGIRRSFDIACASPRVAYLGGITARDGDVQRALGFRWSASGLETLAMRSQLLLDARAAAVPNPVTGVWTDVSDLDGLRSFGQQSRDIGYEGMFVIHPSHVAVVNEVFSPDDAEQQRYARLLASYDEACRRGRTAVAFEGRLIDSAMARTARERLAVGRKDPTR
jgi:citrate lyase subunit beta/citryl-CoA lyase